MRLPGPLWRRSALRLLTEGTPALLVVASFGLLATAAASGPPFGEAAGNAALGTVLAGVSPDAPPARGTGLRIAGGSPSVTGADQQRRLADAAQVPGMSAPTLSGISVGPETSETLVRIVMRVAAGSRSELVRLAAVQDASRFLVAAGPAAPAPPPSGTPDPAPGPSARARVWLSEPMGRALGVAPGDAVVVETTRGEKRKAVPATLAGLYAVAEDGRRPADAAGTTYWASRRADLPRNTTYATLPSPLVVTDVPTAQRLARALDDKLLWTVDARLDPATDTLDEASATAAGIERLGLEVRDPASGAETSGALSTSVASGLPALVSTARAAAEATRARTDSLTRAAITLAGVVVLGTAALTLSRRRTELGLGGALGLGPGRSAGLAVVEHLPAALLGGALGLGAAWLLVGVAGPAGRLTPASAGAALANVVTVMALALAGVAALTAAAAALAARPSRSAPRRRFPWELLLGVAAATATLGLVTTEDTGRPEGALALLVPLLLVAGIGAVGARLAQLVLARTLRGRPAAVTGRTGRTGRADGRSRRARGGRGRAFRGLALRRLAGPGARAAVVAVLASGTGLLAFGLAGAASTRTTIDDRVAVAAGASATATVPASWQLDPGAAVEPPPPPPDEPLVEPPLPVPGVRTPPLGPGRTVTWRTKIGDPTRYGSLDLLVADPAALDSAADWGRGPALAQARGLLGRLRDEDRRAFAILDAGSNTAVPVLAIGHPTLTVGERFTIRPGDRPFTVQVVGVAGVFPSLTPLPMLVVPADSVFRATPDEDPRVEPSQAGGRRLAYPFVSLWTSGGASDARAVLADADIGDLAVATSQDRRQQPELQAAVAALGYQQALGWAAALVALVAFAVHADRAAASSRLTDLFLVRVGLGARGVRRARTLELLAMALVAAALALVSVLLLRPIGARLLDPQRSAAPAFELVVGPGVLAVTGGFVLAATAVAALAAAVRSRRGTAEEVLRDA